MDEIGASPGEGEAEADKSESGSPATKLLGSSTKAGRGDSGRPILEVIWEVSLGTGEESIGEEGRLPGLERDPEMLWRWS